MDLNLRREIRKTLERHFRKSQAEEDFRRATASLVEDVCSSEHTRLIFFDLVTTGFLLRRKISLLEWQRALDALEVAMSVSGPVRQATASRLSALYDAATRLGPRGASWFRSKLQSWVYQYRTEFSVAIGQLHKKDRSIPVVPPVGQTEPPTLQPSSQSMPAPQQSALLSELNSLMEQTQQCMNLLSETPTESDPGELDKIQTLRTTLSDSIHGLESILVQLGPNSEHHQARSLTHTARTKLDEITLQLQYLSAYLTSTQQSDDEEDDIEFEDDE